MKFSKEILKEILEKDKEEEAKKEKTKAETEAKTFLLKIRTNINNTRMKDFEIRLSRKVFKIPEDEVRMIFVSGNIFEQIKKILNATFSFESESIIIKDILEKENIFLHFVGRESIGY